MQKKTKHFWMTSEDRFLIQMYPTMNTKEIALALNRSVSAIYGRVNDLGLKKDKCANHTDWTPELIEKLKTEFPVRMTPELVKEWGISQRTIIRKARELGISKAENFHELNQKKINQLISENHAPNPYKGLKGWTVPGGEKFQFKKGHKPNIDYEKATATRNETIRKEKLRLKYGLKQKTNIKLDNFQ
jgi:hypothetical protein